MFIMYNMIKSDMRRGYGYEKLQMRVDELNGLQSGLMRIGVFSSVATHWLPNILAVFGVYG